MLLQHKPFYKADFQTVILECCLNADESRAFPGGITWQAKIKLQLIFMLAYEAALNYRTVSCVSDQTFLEISELE